MYKIGIMGLGHIAGVMADSIKKLPDHKVTAVASRSLAKAEDFALKHCKSAMTFGSYEELVREDLDLIYIATPNHCHYGNALLAIRAGHNVLVEKPFAMNSEETAEVFREAVGRGVLVCEAMWTCFMPIHRTMLGWIEEGKIGKVKYISSNLGYDIEHTRRLTDPTMGGGSYPDLGVYTTNLAMSILGEDLIATSCYARRINSGVEKDVFYTLENQDRSSVAASYVTMCAATDKDGSIVGTNGRIRLVNINNYERAVLYDKEGRILEEVVRDDSKPNGYALEVKACTRAISAGRRQTDEMPWSRTTALMKMQDTLKSMM
ncbi:Predicted dehydrogenase [Ruminococcaceae bacterium YRB3002]|nr:Predicted dehydrogenase [Ruminococcaceae bacterium YRB3002]